MTRRLSLRDAFERFRSEESGLATMEFVILFPVFFTIFLSGFELSFVMLRQMFLERALDLTVRDLRLGTWPNVTTAILKTSICDRVGNLLGNCQGELVIELQPVDRTTWTTPNPAAYCVNRDTNVQPTVSFDAGTENEMVLIRVCAIIDPFFPGSALALILEPNAGDGMAIVATSGFVNEPSVGGEG